ncbi:YggS family pyridoxal phosphate-dependent enzyme [Thiomicrorhabdus sp. 6S3-12]|uniref:YggS family pyridoxal phosphate-dependent enzyme n=1 Tax=Thiomicrorhabdus sp. 6S3-12 TaxID=2819681 RepID=UPI001AAC5F29|nr:YggS family pyridoxal phosphate-dependent enzyme [Thiomicrorhabdus sp. 6S3-12]MBO1923898.1 YggS family pyridoxal phosphate-dependent enzyme [Thiomicrorhabdus sp. 6S3-12]
MSLPQATPQRQQQLQENFQKVEQRIEEACHKAERPRESVQLLAVSKTKPLEDVLSLAAIGQQAFGENYLQEALDKIAQAPDLEWHFIGPIQSNKTRPIAENFAWVHSVDRLKIARRLSEQRPPNSAALKILLEINLDDESSKAGFNEHDIEDAVSEVLQMPHIELRGLMAIPMIRSDFAGQRAVFRRLKILLDALQKKFPDARLDTLSMGMSGDLEAAIMEGATWIRIGTDLFGARDYGSKA